MTYKVKVYYFKYFNQGAYFLKVSLDQYKSHKYFIQSITYQNSKTITKNLKIDIILTT